MPSLPPNSADDDLLDTIVKKASLCRLQAISCTGDRKWALLAMAEELEELDHAMRAQAHQRPRTGR